MSEPTPETAATAMGDDAMDDDAMTSLSARHAAEDGEEPSMEDILASIRKIIADDSDPVPLDGPTPAAASPATLDDVTHLAPTSSSVEGGLDLADTAAQADLDADELDIEALLSDIQVSEPETPPQSPVIDQDGDVPAFTTASPAPGLDDELSIPDVSADADLAEVSPVEASVADSDDDMDRLMSEMLTEMEALPVDPVVETPSTPDPEIKLDTSDADELDLVKSLMADLTDEDEQPTSDMLAVESTVQGEGAISPDVATSIEAPEDDILDSILDMTLADEIATGPDGDVSDIDVPEAELLASVEVETEIVAQMVTVDTVMEVTEPVTTGEVPSLSDIAAAAEAGLSASASNGEARDDDVAAAVALLAGSEPDTPGEPQPEAVTADPEPETPTPSFSAPTPQDTPDLETPMPRAVRSDAILDDVTEEATMSAFAQLNQVVEDQAILSERGPRIGDLVQDALKPMLKEWLDENLQAIVERAVAKEVKRLSSGK